MLLLQPPVLEVFYSPTCAPCRLELPAVAEFAKADGMRVRIVILDHAKRARDELRTASSRLAAVALVPLQREPRAALRAAGDADGILPYARALDASGRVCATWRGRLSLAKARELIASCARFISPRSRRS